MSFEITFLGSSGGPLEGNTCSILIKPLHLSYQTIIDHKLSDEILCIDAGSGLGRLSEIIHQESLTKKPHSKMLTFYEDAKPMTYYYHHKIHITTPFKDFRPHRALFHAQKLFNIIKTFLITHPHLDHVASLVINSAGFTNSPSKNILGAKQTTNALQRHLFNGIIWPNMPSFEVVNLVPIPFDKPITINNNAYTIYMFEISHGEFNKFDDHRRRSIIVQPIMNGTLADQRQGHYVSSAYLIKHNMTTSSLLIFGDFESDKISHLNHNIKIWKTIAPLIIEHKLKGIVMECSNTLNVPDDELYGHLTPQYIIYELNRLNDECKKLDPATKQPLRGLDIIVDHVKEPIIDFESDENVKEPRGRILDELNRLNQKEGLGCRFSIALSGVSILL